MGSSAIFNGAYVKLLKDQLKLKDSARILTGTDDPSSVAKEGETGSIYLKQAVNTVVPEAFSVIGTGLGNTTFPQEDVLAIAVLQGAVYAGGTFTTGGGAPASYFAKWNGTNWVSVGTFNERVRALAVYNNELYIGGDFTDGGSITGANRLVKYNGTSFSLVGSSNSIPNDAVRALQVYNNELYIGGGFSGAGGVSAGSIIRWNGSSYSAVGTGGGSGIYVYALAVYSNELYIGGSFFNIGSVSGSACIAKWNGSSYSLVGSANSFNGSSHSVYGLAARSDGLYIGGFFFSAGSVSGADYIVRWSGSSYNLVGSANAITNTVLSVGSFNDQVFIGGIFSGSARKWDGTTLSTFGSFSDRVMSFYADNSTFYIGGNFTDYGGNANGDKIVSYAASYTVTTPAGVYTKTDNGTTTNWKELVDTFNDQTVGGDKTFTGNATVNGILKLGTDARVIRGTDDPTSVAKEAESGSLYLRQLQNIVYPEAFSAFSAGFNQAITAIAYYNDELYAGGSFSTAGGSAIPYLAKWNGTSWVSVGSFNNRIEDLTVYNGELYIGGQFTDGGGVTGANRLVKYNGSAFSLVGPASSFNNIVYCFTTYNGELYIGGQFTDGGGVTGANRLVKYNGSTFSLVGPASSFDNTVYALEALGTDLYVGGFFANGGGVTGAQRLVKYNGSTFSLVGPASSFNGIVWALKALGTDLYIGGDFNNSGVTGANYLVKWNGSAFSLVGPASSFNNTVYALEALGTDLYIGGLFTTVGGVTGANRLVKYNGSAFSLVGPASSFNNTVYTLEALGTDLYVGGLFTDGGGVTGANRLVKFTPAGSITTPAGVYTKTDNGTTTNWTELGGGSGGAVNEVTQNSHGFNVGNVVYLNGSTYALAKADTSPTAEAIGVISNVVTANTFEVTELGYLSGIDTTNTVEGGAALTAGTVYFLSASADGKLTDIEPAIIGSISKPMLIADGAASGYVLNYRGSVVGSVNARTQITLANNTTTTVQDVSVYDAGELTGWVILTNTTAANSLRFYVQAPFAKYGGSNNYYISPSYMGDTPPAGFTMTVTAGGLIQITMPNWPGYSSAAINYALNAPAVGTNFPLSVDASAITSGTVAAARLPSFAPTQTRYTSGSGTYTVPVGAKWLKIRMIGGGGAGGTSGFLGSAGGPGGAGGSSLFSTFLTCGGGLGGLGGAQNAGNALPRVNPNTLDNRSPATTGGAATITPTAGVSAIGMTGGMGTGGTLFGDWFLAKNAQAFYQYGFASGGSGGSSAFGGGGGGGSGGSQMVGSSAGGAGAANTGAGGGGGGLLATSDLPTGGAGGGAGAYIEAIITSLASTYSYTVGAGGTVGANPSGAVGGAGGSGVIIIEAYYY